MKRNLLLIIALFVYSALVAGCSDLKFTTWFTLAPKDPSAVTAENLSLAQEVLLKRFRSVLSGEATVRSENNNLRVGLTNESDSPLAIKLATNVGVITFVHSDEPIETGKTVPSDMQVIITDADIDTALLESDQSQRWLVNFMLTPTGTDKIATYSEDHVGAYLVITQDSIVILSPIVQANMMDGEAQIAGISDKETAQILVAEFNSGRLPFQLVLQDQVVASQHSVHPTGGSRRVFKQFAWLEVGSGKVA